MRMLRPFRSDLAHFFSSQTIRMVRSVVLLACIAIAITALFVTPSSADALGQTLFAKAVALVTGAPEPSKSSPEISGWRINPALTVILEEASQSSSSTMSVERRGHTATRLADGRVLIAGGADTMATLNHAEIFDPAAGTFSTTGNLNSGRADHSATLLADGRVLIVGGRNEAGLLITTDIFDPATGVFTAGPELRVARASHSATLFADGRVFIAGGDGDGTAEIYDSTANSFSDAGGSLGTARSMHSAALMLDGRIVIAGGRDRAGNALGTVEIFDTAAANFSTVDGVLRVARVLPHLRVLFDGKVQVIGGNDDGSMEIYDPLIETIGAYAHVLPESDPCTGFINHILSSETRSALFYAGSSDAPRDRRGHTITELSVSNQALVLGGANSSGAVLNSAALLDSSAASITTDKLDYAPGEIAVIFGRGFQPGEIVRVKIHEDPHTPQERGFEATADGDGNFTGEYLVQDYDLAMKFIVGARGLSSGFTAQTTFTDSRMITSVTLNNVASVTVSPGASITAVVNVTTDNAGGNQNWRSTGWRISTTPPGTVICVNHTNHDGIGNYSETFSVTAPTTGSTYNAYFVAYSNENCTNQPSTTFVLTNGVTLEATFPTVLSINRANGSPTNLSNLTWTVTFSESVTGVDASDFAVVNTGLSGTPAITGVTQTSGSTYNVTASTGNGTGSIGLNLNDNDSITDVGGNKLGGTGTGGTGNGSFTGQIHSLDRTLTPVITVANKDYDGNSTSAILTRTFTSNLTVTDDVQVDGGTANFVDANAGTGKTVNITGLTLIGVDAARYILSSASATATANINKAASTTTITCPTNVTYTGAAIEPCTAAVTGANLSDSVAVSYSNNINAGTATATATYAESANHLGSTDSENFTIDKAASTTTITCPTNVTYTGAAIEPCTAAVTGANLSESVAVSYSNNINAGTATATATYAESANHLGISGTETFIISRAEATISVTGYTGVYDGAAHGATGIATGVLGEALAGLNLGASFTNVPGGIASWTFTDVTGNYNNAAGTAAIVINQATPTVTVIGGTYTYNFLPHAANGFAYGVSGLADVLVPAVTFEYAGTGVTTFTPTATAPTLVGTYSVTASFAGNLNYTPALATANLTIVTACAAFNGFLPPVGGSVENGNGGSFTSPVRSFKLNSTIPVKFNAICFGVPLTSGVHTLQAIKYSNSTTSYSPIDATPTDAATTGNQFRLTGADWHFNLNTKEFGSNGQGIWLFKATLFDGSTYSVWVEIKK